MRYTVITRYWSNYSYYAVLFFRTGQPTRVRLGVVDDFGDLQPIERRLARQPKTEADILK